MKESRCNEGQHSWEWGGGSRSYVSWHKLIFQPSPSLMQQNRVRQSSLYLKVLPQLWSFPFSGNVSLQRGSGLIWDDVLGHVCWPCRAAWACLLFMSCVILERSPVTLVTAARAKCCCTAQVPCLPGKAVTSILLITQGSVHFQSHRWYLAMNENEKANERKQSLLPKLHFQRP